MFTVLPVIIVTIILQSEKNVIQCILTLKLAIFWETFAKDTDIENPYILYCCLAHVGFML